MKRREICRALLLLLILFGYSPSVFSIPAKVLSEIKDLQHVDLRFLSQCDLDGSSDPYLIVGLVDKQFHHEVAAFARKDKKLVEIFRFRGRLGQETLERVYCLDIDRDGYEEIISFWTSGAHTNVLRIFRYTTSNLSLVFEGSDRNEPELIDVDSDGKLEVILNGNEKSRIFSWDGYKFILRREVEPRKRLIH